MPLMRCQKNKVKGWKWGSSGTCYTGLTAKAKAKAQGRAIEASKNKVLSKK